MELYFAGGSTNKKLEDFMWNKNCNRLFSQFREKTNIKKYIERGGNNIFLDSGAFSAYNSGSIIDIDELCLFANSITEHCKFIASLDVIGDAPKSFENFIYMRKRLKEPNKLIPTFHINEPIEYLYKYFDYEDEFGRLDKLALGGIAKQSKKNQKRFLDMCEPICEKYQNVWIHVFGVTNFPLINCYSFIDSIDSTKHIMQPIYGHLILPPRYKCISIGVHSKYKDLLSVCDSQIINSICSRINVSIEELVKYDWARSIFYVEVMLEWLDKFNYSQLKMNVKRKRLF